MVQFSRKIERLKKKVGKYFYAYMTKLRRRNFLGLTKKIKNTELTDELAYPMT